MTDKISTISGYLKSLTESDRLIIEQLRSTITKNLPKGFEETINYGMIGYVVPLSTYPKGYRGDPKSPLPFMNIAAQKNHIAVYHMGIYTDKKLLNWFNEEYLKRTGKNPDIGKSCIRLKKKEEVPLKLIGELSKKISVTQWIEIYENAIKK